MNWPWQLLWRYILFGAIAGALTAVASMFFNLDPLWFGLVCTFVAAFAAGISSGSSVRT